MARKAVYRLVLGGNGALGGTRTHGLCLRRAELNNQPNSGVPRYETAPRPTSFRKYVQRPKFSLRAVVKNHERPPVPPYPLE